MLRCCHTSTMAKPRVVKDCGLKKKASRDGDRCYICEQNLSCKITEMEASQKALVEKVDNLVKCLETAGKPNSIAKRIANELIAWKQQANPTLMSPPDEWTHAPFATNQRIPVTPPNSGHTKLLKTVTEGMLRELGTTCHCQPCRTWFLHVAESSRCRFRCDCREDSSDDALPKPKVPEFTPSFGSDRARSKNSAPPPPSWKCKCTSWGASENEI